MIQNKILIAGGSGLLAWCWALARTRSENIILLKNRREIPHSYWPVRQVSLNDKEGLLKLIDQEKINLCINCAGMANVEACEASPNEAYYVNSKLAGSLASICSKSDIGFIHISTDHLFSDQRKIYTEIDKPDPQNVYALSKLYGEEEVLSVCKDALIIRSNFYGHGLSYRQSFSDKIILSLMQKKEIRLFEDVTFSPILASNLANISHSLWGLGCRGIFNVSSDDCVTKLQFGKILAETFGLNSRLIVSSMFRDRFDLVRRPRIMSLDNTKAKIALGYSLGSVKDHLKLLKEEKSLNLSFKSGYN